MSDSWRHTISRHLGGVCAREGGAWLLNHRQPICWWSRPTCSNPTTSQLGSTQHHCVINARYCISSPIRSHYLTQGVCRQPSSSKEFDGTCSWHFSCSLNITRMEQVLIKSLLLIVQLYCFHPDYWKTTPRTVLLIIQCGTTIGFFSLWYTTHPTFVIKAIDVCRKLFTSPLPPC